MSIYPKKIAKNLLRSLCNKKIEFGDLSHVSFIGNSKSTLITNKAGRTVITAQLDGVQVKVYEAFSNEHANFISSVSTSMPENFPRVIEVRDAWVITEWVNGFTVESNPEQTEAHAALLRDIHSFDVTKLPSSGFDYWNDFLVPRFMRSVSLIEKQSTGNWIIEQVDAFQSTQQPKLIHPDLTPANMLTCDGQLVTIDNELLSIGWLPELDLYNAMRPLSDNAKAKLAIAWFGEQLPPDEELFPLALAWIVREVGAAFISGRLEKSYKLIQSAESDPISVLPFSINELRNINASANKT